MRAVILAGGLGTRLKPYTTSLPKPLMPIAGELPILEIVLRQLKRDGFDRVTLAVGHMREIIRAFCNDGSKWGLQIDYSIEEKPLSTIGPLTLIDDLPDDFLVMNGDILTDLSFKALYEAHVAKNADVTVTTTKRVTKIDYGVLELDGDKITAFIEKPQYDFEVSMGVYVVRRALIDALPRNEPYGFDSLMLDGLKAGQRIHSYAFDGQWLDIGRPEDYDLANEAFENQRETFLPSP